MVYDEVMGSCVGCRLVGRWAPETGGDTPGYSMPIYIAIIMWGSGTYLVRYILNNARAVAKITANDLTALA